jgi:hypothetical protein
MNKKTLMVTGLVTALTVGLSLTPKAQAFWPFDNDNQTAETTTVRIAPMQNMMQKLSEKLGLNQDEVKTAMEEIRTERQAEAKQQFETNLTQAVTDGKITQEQKEYILGKHNEIANQQQVVSNLRQELRTWAEQNNIDLPLMGGMGKGRGMGEGQGMGRGRGGNW